MAMTSNRLKAYLELERQMLTLDDAGDPLADVLREAMDPLWYGLSDEEHLLLNERTISIGSGVSLKTPVGSDLFLAPPIIKGLEERKDPLRSIDWECAA